MDILSELLRAERLGKEAFKKGFKRTPALDKDLIKMVEPRPIKVRIKLYSSWLEGWDKENLK